MIGRERDLRAVSNARSQVHINTISQSRFLAVRSEEFQKPDRSVMQQAISLSLGKKGNPTIASVK